MRGPFTEHFFLKLLTLGQQRRSCFLQRRLLRLASCPQFAAFLIHQRLKLLSLVRQPLLFRVSFRDQLPPQFATLLIPALPQLDQRCLPCLFSFGLKFLPPLVQRRVTLTEQRFQLSLELLKLRSFRVEFALSRGNLPVELRPVVPPLLIQLVPLSIGLPGKFLFRLFNLAKLSLSLRSEFAFDSGHRLVMRCSLTFQPCSLGRLLPLPVLTLLLELRPFGVEIGSQLSPQSATLHFDIAA